MRWIEDAVQKGRDHGAGLDTLLPFSVIRETIGNQKKLEAERQKEAEKKQEEGKIMQLYIHY